MAQAPLKSTKSAARPQKNGSKTSKSNISKTKKGGRTIAPKKKGLVSGREVVRKHTAGLTALTERTLGARVGHLELLGGGKKDKKMVGKDGKGKGDAKAGKGGTRKFG